MNPEPERTAVYWIRGEAAVLLYIGMTNAVSIRWNGHQAIQPWWDELRSITVEWYETREEAAAAEKAAILAEQPKYNVTYLKPLRGQYQPRGMLAPLDWETVEVKPRDDDDDALLNLNDIAKMIRAVTPGEARGVLKRGGGPAGFMIGSNRVWRKGQIRRWIAALERSQQLPSTQPADDGVTVLQARPRAAKRGTA